MGGYFTQFLVGKSKGANSSDVKDDFDAVASFLDRDQFPLRNLITKYVDLIESQTKGNDNLIISQTILDGVMLLVSSPSARYSPRPATAVTRDNKYSQAQESIESQKKLSRNIYSMEANERLGFCLFFMEGYGKEQFVVPWFAGCLSQKKKCKKTCRCEKNFTMDMEKLRQSGKQITSCASRFQHIFLVMTSDVDRFKGKFQYVIIGRQWIYCSTEINKAQSKGYVITDICYNHSSQIYFIVVTKLNCKQNLEVLTELWEAKMVIKANHQQNFHVRKLFRDPNTNSIIAIFQTDIDGNSPCETFIAEYLLKDEK